MKFHHTLNQAPRSAKQNGQHRRAGTPAYRNPADGTDNGAGGTDQDRTITWYTFTTPSPGTWITIDFANTNTESAKPPAIPYAGIRTGELIGHRLWWLIKEEGEFCLCSLAHRQLWKPGETLSGDVDQIVWHDPTFYDVIWGGIYAFADPIFISEEVRILQRNIRDWRSGRVALMWGHWHSFMESATLVAGTIKQWGEVIEHQIGHRSQFAKLNSIDNIWGPGDLDALRERYGVHSLITSAD